MTRSFHVDPRYGPEIPNQNPNPVQPPPMIGIDGNNNHVIPNLNQGVAQLPIGFGLNGSSIRYQPVQNIRASPSPQRGYGRVQQRPVNVSTSSQPRGEVHGLIPSDFQSGFLLTIALECAQTGSSPRRRVRHPAGQNINTGTINPPHATVLLTPSSSASQLAINVDNMQDEERITKMTVYIEYGLVLKTVADRFEIETRIRRGRDSSGRPFRQQSVRFRCSVSFSTLALIVLGFITWRSLRRLL